MRVRVRVPRCTECAAAACPGATATSSPVYYHPGQRASVAAQLLTEYGNTPEALMRMLSGLGRRHIAEFRRDWP